LKTNEKELQNIYQELFKMRGFSEDCVKSILHCLICTLIKLTKSDKLEVCILSNIYIINISVSIFSFDFYGYCNKSINN